MKVDDDNFIVRANLPAALQGLKYSDIDFMRTYHLQLISVARPVKTTNIIGIKHESLKKIDLADKSLVAQTGDVIVCMGNRSDFYTFFSSISKE